MITTTTVVRLKHSPVQTVTPGSSFGAMFHPATGSGVRQMSPGSPGKSTENITFGDIPLEFTLVYQGKYLTFKLTSAV